MLPAKQPGHAVGENVLINPRPLRQVLDQAGDIIRVQLAAWFQLLTVGGKRPDRKGSASTLTSALRASCAFLGLFLARQH